ncbi:hypothetical protein ACFDTO_33560 [Microbacteriaceae bacterium 4G12]
MKKGLLIILGISVIAIGIYFFFFRNVNVNVISEEEIGQKDFLQDKQAVVYLSSTADQDMDGKGISYAIFIDKNGKASGYKMDGLELGGIGVSDNKKELLLESKDKLMIVGENFTNFKTKYQHTGEYRTYLKKENLFVNIYNSGVNQKTGQYDSNVVYGNVKGIQMGNIPHYLMSSGTDGEAVVVMTEDLDENKREHSLQRLTFQDGKMTAQDVGKINFNTNMEYSSYSSILSDTKYYYHIVNENDGTVGEKVYLLRMDKTTLTPELIPIFSSQDPVGGIPFTIKNAAHLYNNDLYFINGFGEVFVFHTETSSMTKKFKIDYHVTDGVRYNEQIFFKDDQLYVLRYDEDRKNKYYIENYSLKDGKKVKETEVTGMDKIIKSVRGGKSVHAYDFKVFD